MIAIQKRSGKTHLVDDSKLATLCGRTLHRTKWKTSRGTRAECQHCWRVLAAQLGIAPLMGRRDGA